MNLLPTGYETLEPFAAEWALPTSAERADKRGSSDPQSRKDFHAAVLPLAGKALTELDAKPLAALDAREKRLLDLLLTFGHVALSIEIQGDAEATHTPWRNRMRITTTPADLPA